MEKHVVTLSDCYKAKILYELKKLKEEGLLEEFLELLKKTSNS